MDDILKYDKFKQFDKLIHGTTLKNDIFPHMFSFAFHTGEDIKEISKNRSYLLEKLGIDKDFDIVLANQTHSSNILVINNAKTLGWKNHDDAVEDCDALITNQKNILIGILTADCVPILLFDKTKEVIAAVHAGWKGTKAEILLKTVQKMSETFNSNPKDIYAIIAPSIGACCYEVGSDVADNFGQNVKKQLSNDKYILDLKMENYNQLINAGLKSENIEASQKCTSCDNDRFFSYRKEQGCSGRFLSFIGMK
ncbi:MAG: peptidoglycan editing factor PgeF [Sulfurovaceae bacterium]|nr:peptidoglycan editing factor PgeF [Sulfurovaceae bacterium]MDD5548796.1 peptidoglycan editing factor PgeF [Sulfurovaceae bacterium]